MWASASNALFNFLSYIQSWVGSWGWAIVILTIIIRLLLHPLNKKQMMSMQQMQKIQPRLKMLQQKYANDKERLGKETMALYKQYNVNPAAGCLPLLVQMPILILLFSVLRNADFGGATFFGLSLEGSVLTTLAKATGLAFTNANELGFFKVLNHVFTHPAGLANVSVYGMNLLLVVLVCLLTYWQQKMSMAGNQDMKTMMIMMPILMAFICLSLPGGVALYWALSSGIGVVQQYFIMKKVANEEKPTLLKEKPKTEQ